MTAALYGTNAWQQLCSHELLRCLELQVSQFEKARRWRRSKRYLERPFQVLTGQGYGANGERVVLADLDLSGCDLSGFDFRRAYLTRINFSGATAARADFRQSIVSECRLAGLRLRGADLSHANIRASATGLAEILYDKLTRMNGIDPTGLPPGLTDRINADNRRFNRFGEMRSGLERAVLVYTNYGRSAPAILGVAAAVWLFFTAFHLWFTLWEPGGWRGWANARQAALLSAEALMGLDASMPVDPWWRLVFITETGFGILVLALVVASMTNKIVELAKDA